MLHRLGFSMFFTLTIISSSLLAVDNPIELGKVAWIRSLDKGLEKAQDEDKPVLILFQEVPGCSTCQRYGSGALSHPLIVEAIEMFFVPVAIYNNKGGKDAEALEYFGEPAWNNPVVRVVDHTKKDITKRLAGDYSAQGLVHTMMTALSLTGHKIPEYLNILAQELGADHTETATYSMYCFWSGEAHFGKRHGVLATEAGHSSSGEVVKVTYDPSQISKNDLDQYASQEGCKPVGKVNNYRIDSEPKYYLSKSTYRYLPMTDLQKSRVNSALKNRMDANEYLSSRQIDVMNKFQKGTYAKVDNVVLVPFQQAWNKLRVPLNTPE